MGEMGDPATESIRAIVQRLASNIAAMLQTYALLAGQETRATVRDIATGVLFLGVAAVLGVLVLTMTVVVAVLALSVVLPPWLAAAVVLDLTAIIMVLLLLIARWRLRRLRLRKLAQALKEDLAWLRTELLGND